MSEPASRDAAERYRLTLELFAAGESLMRENLRRRFPDATPDEIEDHLTAWLLERPGARHGDAIGRPGTWPRRR
jgi:hypothetical protein